MRGVRRALLLAAVSVSWSSAAAQSPAPEVCLSVYGTAVQTCALQDETIFPGSGALTCTERALQDLNACIAPAASSPYTVEANPGEAVVVRLDQFGVPEFDLPVGDSPAVARAGSVTRHQRRRPSHSPSRQDDRAC